MQTKVAQLTACAPAIGVATLICLHYRWGADQIAYVDQECDPKPGQLLLVAKGTAVVTCPIPGAKGTAVCYTAHTVSSRKCRLSYSLHQPKCILTCCSMEGHKTEPQARQQQLHRQQKLRSGCWGLQHPTAPSQTICCGCRFAEA